MRVDLLVGRHASCAGEAFILLLQRICMTDIFQGKISLTTCGKGFWSFLLAWHIGRC